MLCFTAVFIGLLWILQTVYLDDFYRFTKMHEFEKAIEEMEASKDNGLDEKISEVAKKYDLCVMLTDTHGRIICTAESNIDCTVHLMTSLQLARYYELVSENGGEVIYDSEDIVVFEEGRPYPDKNQGGFPFDRFNEFEEIPSRRNYSYDGVVGMKIIELSSGTELMIVVNSMLTPVEATVDTIRTQLIVISVVLVIFALIMATIVSMSVSKSIAKVNDSAKELAKGNFDVKFDGNDYREVAELSETLNYAAVELGKAEEIQRELIANVSHDLRTPLTLITAYSEVMRDLPGENTPENVQVIIDEAKRLTLLVNDLLDISKLQAGVDNMSLKVYDLTEAIKRVIDRYGKLVEQEDYKIEFRFYENVFVEADEFKIYQVVYNLINNAINYTGEDKTVIVNQIVNGDIVRIEVCDTGKGIPKEEIKNVWERYYKIDKKHKRAIMGTGLGLSIVKNILIRHNARYGVESEVGKGSKFWFELTAVRNGEGYGHRSI